MPRLTAKQRAAWEKSRDLNAELREALNDAPCSASVPFRAADFLHTRADIAGYLQEMLADGDTRVIPVALRTVRDAVGGTAALAEQVGLRRETLYRELSTNGHSRLHTLAAILDAFGLRLSVQLAKRRKHSPTKAATGRAASR